jgi:hypothetical protein
VEIEKISRSPIPRRQRGIRLRSQKTAIKKNGRIRNTGKYNSLNGLFFKRKKNPANYKRLYLPRT